MADSEQTGQTKMQQKLARMQASVRMGGKGTMRRKKKAVHRAAPTDEKRLQATIKRMGLTQIAGIEEVNLFRDDEQVTNFQNPKVQALIGANTYVISGQNQTKPLQEMLPSLLNQLGPDNIKNIKNIMEHLVANGGANAGAAGGGQAEGEDEVPDLMENTNFEEAAAATKPATVDEIETEEVEGAPAVGEAEAAEGRDAPAEVEVGGAAAGSAEAEGAEAEADPAADELGKAEATPAKVIPAEAESAPAEQPSAVENAGDES